MELLDELGVQLQGIKGHRIGDTGEIREAEEQEEVPAIPILPVDLRPVRGEEDPLVDVAGSPQPPPHGGPPGLQVESAHDTEIVLHSARPTSRSIARRGV